MKAKNGKTEHKTFAAKVGRALRRAGVAARKTARAHGTPIYLARRQSGRGKTLTCRGETLQERRTRSALLPGFPFQGSEQPV
jgi:hypothetical protein